MPEVDDATPLTVGDVASRLGFTEATVRGWLEEGRLRGMKFPKGWRITRADFDAFVRAATNVQPHDDDQAGGLWDDDDEQPAA
jgi:excisionase family DNA binding protein